MSGCQRICTEIAFVTLGALGVQLGMLKRNWDQQDHVKEQCTNSITINCSAPASIILFSRRVDSMEETGPDSAEGDTMVIAYLGRALTGQPWVVL